jgi:curli production assembly/transport component CsgF
MRFVAGMLASFALAGAAHGSEIVYTPINPNFGGSPLNGSMLMSQAAAQKPNPPASASSQQTAAQQFLRMLQSQLYASLASSVSQAITGVNAQQSGTIKLDNMQITWTTVDGVKEVTITDLSTGSVTQISVPVVGS